MRRPFDLLLSSRRSAALVLVFWLLVAGALGSVAPTLKSVEDNKSANDAPSRSDSVLAQRALDKAFPGTDAVPALVVVHAREGGPEATSNAVAQVTRAVRDLGGKDVLPISPGCSGDLVPGRDCVPGQQGLVSPDGGTQIVVVPVTGEPTDESFRDRVGDIQRAAAKAAPDTVTTAVTGPAGIITDTTKVFASSDLVLLFGTIALVLLILLSIYRSPLLALVPLLAVGVAMRVSQSIGALLADAGAIAVSGQTASIMTVLLFGVGTDYALIITARYREELIATPADHLAAMRRAMAGVSESVLSSASTVVLAMLALLVCISPSLRGFAPYFALGVTVMALVALTFIPALTVLLGRAVFWPLRQDRAAQRALGGRFWHRVADLVIESPKKVLAGTLAALALMSCGLVGYSESFDFVSGFRVQTQSETGQDLVARDLGPGEIAPATVLLTGSGITAEQAQATATALTKASGDVARTAFNPRTDLAADGAAARITVVLEHGPYLPAALDAVAGLRVDAQGAARAAGIDGALAQVAGETATTADTRSALDRDMLVLVPVILLIVGLVLGLLLRSVLAPVYLIATLVLSFAATMGMLMLISVHLGSDIGIGNRVTAYVFVFLVALGVDYNIFIMSRLRQELAHSTPVEALRTAMTRTGGVVSSAGLILAGTFAVLMTQPIRELYQFGLAMAIGIVLDTFVVRPMLVPAIVRLLGDRALWPQRSAIPVTRP